MLIYIVNWLDGGVCALSAVVVARTEKEAIAALSLSEDDTQIRAGAIGREFEEESSESPWVVCLESL